jgi:hypothetical protein
MSPGAPADSTRCDADARPKLAGLAPKLLPGRQELLDFTHAAGSNPAISTALGTFAAKDPLAGFQALFEVHLTEKAGAEAFCVVVDTDLKV